MNTKRYLVLFASALSMFALSSCNEFLDVVPDNRTELDSEDKIVKMLVSAYPTSTYLTVGEFSSDNVDRVDVENPDNELYIRQMSLWQQGTVPNNGDDPNSIWSSYYLAIASANQVLYAIEDMGATTEVLSAAKGEALLCRAYSHFVLANVFCQAYDPEYADTDLGIPYMEVAETTLNPKYERGTLSHVYEMIDKDLSEGLPLIQDQNYAVPKYHFNTKAAYAFAARFYLYYQKWDKAYECANAVVGSNPASMLRDWKANSSYGFSMSGNNLLATLDYIDSSHSCNLMMGTAFSQMGVAFGSFGAYTEYSPSSWLVETETVYAQTACWGALNSNNSKIGVGYLSSGNMDKALVFRVPYLFEYTDPVAQIGFAHIVQPLFTADEALLIRAEASIMMNDYASALADMNIWLDGITSKNFTLTEDNINSWAGRTNAYSPSVPTVIKPFEAPTFDIAAGTQQNMMYVMAHMRRIETLTQGLRWFDLKRYGMTTYRRQLSGQENLKEVIDYLEPRDPRYAIQIPPDVISAGFEPNPTK